jgi:hypothetical protein
MEPNPYSSTFTRIEKVIEIDNLHYVFHVPLFKTF